MTSMIQVCMLNLNSRRRSLSVSLDNYTVELPGIGNSRPSAELMCMLTKKKTVR